MTRFLFALILAFFVLGNVVRANEANEGCITVQRRDNLTKIARVLNSSVQKLVEINGIKNRHLIYPGQEICREVVVKSSAAMGSKIPQREEQSAKPIDLKKEQVGSATAEGYTPYAEIGVNPLVPKGKRNPKALLPVEQDALRHIGASVDDKKFIEQALVDGTAKHEVLDPGTKFVAMTERGKKRMSVKVTRNRVATWKNPESATTVLLPDGRKMARMDSCWNWVQLERMPPEETPEAVALAMVTPEPVEPNKEVEGCGLDDHDLFLSRGGTSGNGSRTTYRYVDAFLCIVKKRVEGGTVKAGLGGLYGDHHGSADDGFGYRGRRYGVGPTGKYIDDDGWDARFGFLFGRMFNDGHSADGDYRQERNFRNMYGPSIGINLYQREIAGEKWLPKTQIWGSAFRLAGANLSHSWQGTPIEDTNSLKSSWLIALGVRQFLYQGPIKPWISAEYFAEIPSTRNGTLMFGITDEDEILWAGIGKTWNLKSGGSARSWMVGIDVGNGVRKVRSNARHEAWVNTKTSYYDPETGAFTVRKSDLTGDKAVSPPARFDISHGQFAKPVTLMASAQKGTTLRESPTPEPPVATRLQKNKPVVSAPPNKDRWASHWNG